MTQFELRTIDLPTFARHAIGFDRMFNELGRTFANSGKDNYPPYNIAQLDDTHYVIELAVAGFSKSEIEIEFADDRLIVKGSAKEDANPYDYLFQGIAARNFTRTFALNDQIEIKGAALVNGMLKIGLEKIIPEHKKPKKVEIADEEETSAAPSTAEYLAERKDK